MASIPRVESVVLETERLRLRQWRAEDREPFVVMCSDPAVMEFLTGNRDRAHILSRLDAWSSGIAERGWGFWAAETRDAGQLVGFIGLSIPADGHPCLPCVELGWRLGKEHWGKGYATEGARASMRFGFESLDLTDLIATTARGNSRSIAVMERLGMRAEATFEHPHVPADSPHRSHVLYRMSRTEWQVP